jgi:HK97 family phage major capsid protein
MGDETKVGAMISATNKTKIQAAIDVLSELIRNGEIVTDPDKGNAFKTISETPDELRIGNYIVLYGGRDLTGTQRKNQDGSSGEFFSPRTELESSYTKTGLLHVDFEHGQDPDNLGITDDDVLGFVDWKTARKDERGVFVERVLNRRNQYVQWVEELVKAGLVGNSSEAIRGKTEKTTNGEIIKWPLKRDTLTVNPMEPRMLSENAYATIKGLSQEYPALKSLIIGEPQEASGPLVDTVTKNVEPLLKEEPIEMTPDEIKALITATIEEVKRAEPATVNAGANISVVKDAADQPFKSAGEYLRLVKEARLYPEHTDPRIRPLWDNTIKATGMSEGIPADGGYLIPPQFASGILQNMWGSGEILARVSTDPVTGNDMTYNAVDETSRVDGSRIGGIRGYWLAEGGTFTKSKPTFQQISLKLKKEGALVYATDEQLEDTANLESFLMTNVPTELRFLAEDAIFEGNGVGKPWGILPSPALVSVTRTDANKILHDDVMKMWARRKIGGSYVWLINQDVTPQLDQMYITSGIESRFVDYDAQGVLRMKGAPVIEIEYASTLGTVGDILLADLKQYKLITKGGVRSESSIHVQFLTDEMTYRFIYRCDGAPMWKSPVTPFKGSNTVSPFVALSTAS